MMNFPPIAPSDLVDARLVCSKEVGHARHRIRSTWAFWPSKRNGSNKVAGFSHVLSGM